MKIIKANKIFTVFRGLILLALGLFQVVVGLIGMNSKGTSDGSAAQQFAGIFIALFSAIGMILVITGAITVLYSFFVFGNIKRTRRGISRGFLFIDVIANIIAVALAVVVLFADGEDANVYACILLLALAIVGFAFDAVAFRALKAVRGESYGIEHNLSRSKGYKAFSVLGVLFGIIPSVAFAVFARAYHPFPDVVSEFPLLSTEEVSGGITNYESVIVLRFHACITAYTDIERFLVQFAEPAHKIEKRLRVFAVNGMRSGVLRLYLHRFKLRFIVGYRRILYLYGTSRGAQAHQAYESRRGDSQYNSFHPLTPRLFTRRYYEYI